MRSSPLPSGVRLPFPSGMRYASTSKADEVGSSCRNDGSSFVGQSSLGIPSVMPSLFNQISSFGQIPIIIPSLTQTPSASQVPSNVSFSSIPHSSSIDKGKVPESSVPSIAFPDNMNPILAFAAISKLAKRVVYNKGEPGDKDFGKESDGVKRKQGDHSGKDDYAQDKQGSGKYDYIVSSFMDDRVLKEVEQVNLNNTLTAQGNAILGQSVAGSFHGNGEGVEILSNFADGLGNISLGQNVLTDSLVQVDQVTPVSEIAQSVAVLNSGEAGFQRLTDQEDYQHVNQMVIPEVSGTQIGLETSEGNVRVGKENFEICLSNKQVSQSDRSVFYVEHFSILRGFSLALDDERGMVRNREPLDKGYFLDSSTMLRSKELMCRVVADNEGSEDSDDVSLEFSSAEVENRLRSREEDLPMHV
ncbi:unnamed protein product [Ilex paraguariensis]|uniref:Uncharacterized protein n=1 Tax=Ilex paraguariensis TaxID=185542 RepID=A0ABC8RYS2_9AQUA